MGRRGGAGGFDTAATPPTQPPLPPPTQPLLPRASNYVYLVRGTNVGADYVLQAGDVVFVREVAEGATCSMVLAVFAVVSAVMSLGMGVYSAIMQQKAQREAEEAQRQARAMSEQVKQLPFLKGAQNRTALGYNIPYVMGKMYDVPYKITSGCYRISGTDGEKQEWLCAFVAGYKSLDVESISIGTEQITAFPPATGEERIATHVGTGTGDSWESMNWTLQVIERGEFTAPALSPLNCKVTATSYGDEIRNRANDSDEVWSAGIVKQLEQNTFEVDVCIMYDGLRYWSTGHDEWRSTTTAVDMYWKNEAGDNWTYIPGEDGKTSPGGSNLLGHTIVVKRKTNHTIRFYKHIVFTAAQCYGKDLSIKCVRPWPQRDGNEQSTCYLCYINCYQYDPEKSTPQSIKPCLPIEEPWDEQVTRIGVCIESNDNTKDVMDEVNCIVQGKARVWDAAARTWSRIRVPTRNSAAWVLEILTSGIHPASQFSDSEIDLNALGAIYEMCEAHHFYCDGLVTEDTKKADLLTQILTECGTTMLMGADGKWTFAAEGAQSTPVALLNEESIVSATSAVDFSRKPFAIKATFTNRDSWTMDTRYMTIGASGSSTTSDGATTITLANGKEVVYKPLYVYNTGCTVNAVSAIRITVLYSNCNVEIAFCG